MDFDQELAAALPLDLPNRDRVIAVSAEHLKAIVEINSSLNLTRITTPREAAVKHVLDSVLPWRLFDRARHILDAGTGAGFPGIPLSVVLPEAKFTLSESIQKKARFVQSTVERLALQNVKVTHERAEDSLKANRADLVVARAVSPIGRALVLFAPALKAGTRVILYKGPDVELEIADADEDAKRRHIAVRVMHRYELPDGLGSRSMVELSANKK